MVSILVKNFQGISVESKNFDIIDNIYTLKQLKQLVGESFKLNPNHFDLVQRGLCLKDEQRLDSLNIKQGDTLYALKRPRKVDHVTESVDEGTLRHVVHSMKQLLSKAHTRGVLESKMQSRDLLECIIEAVPAFGEDTIAMDALSSTAILTSIFSKKTSKPEKFLDQHRSMVHACLILIEEVKGNGGVAGAGVSSRPDAKALYSLDHMSDNDDDMETDDDDDDPNTPSSSTNQQRSAIRNLIRPFGASITPSSNAFSPSNPSTNTITPDFFRQAMQAINSGFNPLQTPNITSPPPPTSTTTTTATTAPPAVTEDQLHKMSELGVSDRALATTLLTQTRGNLQAAIALFYDSQDFSD